VNARERAAMRRDIQKEQVLAVGAVSKSVGNLKSEIDLLSEKESKRNGKKNSVNFFCSFLLFTH
jgi:translation elongation factor EF-Tu-like GTPase